MIMKQNPEPKKEEDKNGKEEKKGGGGGEKKEEKKTDEDNFGTKSLVGEGSYGRVFYGKLSTGEEAAVKKLDTSSSPEPDNDFTGQ
ncbi:hypothetical protein L2E82_40501 [Cichorium intybus]|uniref:Uncharacterized protein n=1 Tax=Cichorium intybus TaxID=13427 RepID=A0ACB9ALJ8_CICIN|nr:hypothetical protein L2E82_40501 [Cichorium intybus]